MGKVSLGWRDLNFFSIDVVSIWGYFLLNVVINSAFLIQQKS